LCGVVRQAIRIAVALSSSGRAGNIFLIPSPFAGNKVGVIVSYPLPLCGEQGWGNRALSPPPLRGRVRVGGNISGATRHSLDHQLPIELSPKLRIIEGLGVTESHRCQNYYNF